MNERFDPYYKWLGIPPSQQPPHHYRLLGIEAFESDREVIDSAANQRMTYLQELAGGDHIQESQRLLNEIAAARRCLLNPGQKTAYDKALRAKLTPSPQTQPVLNFAELSDDSTRIPVPNRTIKGVKDQPRAPRSKLPLRIGGVIAAIVVLVGGVTLAIALAGQRSRPGPAISAFTPTAISRPLSPKTDAKAPAVASAAPRTVAPNPGRAIAAKPDAATTVVPSFQFAPSNQVLDDPCELLFHQGRYHAFYVQHALETPAKRTWGHAVSQDFRTWQELPAPFAPEGEGALDVGSVVIDLRNSSKLGTGTESPWVAIYTDVRAREFGGTKSPQSIGLAYSLDEGKTWAKYAKNPVIAEYKPGNRHPRVFWHKPSNRWVMLLFLGVVEPGSPIGRMAIFTSPNLCEWTHQSEFNFPGGHECPDLNELPVENEPMQTRWCLLARNGRFHFVEFDGANVKTDPRSFGVLDRGLGLAAPRIGQLPDGRRLLIGIGTSNAPSGAKCLVILSPIYAARNANGTLVPNVSPPAKPASGTALSK